MNNNIHARRLKWIISIVGMVVAGVIMLTLVMMNIWIAFEAAIGNIDPQIYTIGFNLGVVASFFLMTTFGAVLWHSKVPNIKNIIREANECRALGLITDKQNQTLQTVCDEAITKNKILAKQEKERLIKEAEQKRLERLSEIKVVEENDLEE